MDSLRSMNNALEYIEEHLTEEIDYIEVTRPKFARQTKHQVFFSFRNIALHFIINEMLAG